MPKSTMSNTALLVIDVQKGLVEYLPPHRQTELLHNIAALLDKARGAGVPVIYVQHQDEELLPGTRVWEIADEIAPRNGERVVSNGVLHRCDTTRSGAPRVSRHADRRRSCYV